MQTSVTITQVSRLAVSDGNVVDFSVDRPGQQHSESGLHLDLAGWVVGTTRPILSVEVIHNDSVQCRIPVSLQRSDVARRHRDIEWAKTSGFRGQINTLGLPRNFTLTLQAVLRGENETDRLRTPIASITGTHTGLDPDYAPRRQPLLITALGRSGTTWLMRLLSGDEEIAAAAAYPYEIRVGVYWMQVLQVLSSPGNHAQSTKPDGFEANLFGIGSCPYFHPAYLDRLTQQESLTSWFSQDYMDALARFCQQSIDSYYDVLERGQGTDRTRFFMEKNLGGHIPWVYTNTYEAPREIVLIRDFRDMFCSSRAFNEKRGYAAVGKQLANDDEEWIRNRYRGIRKLLDSWKERREDAFLMRYEDLILQPEQSLVSVLDYLGVDASVKRAKQLLKKAREDTPELKAHRTTRDPASSVGRWKKDMDPETQKLFESVFGEVLTEFGYQ